MSGKIGRNDPCPCGSGLKYKKCCGATKHDKAEDSPHSHADGLLHPDEDGAFPFTESDDEDDWGDESDRDEDFERRIDEEIAEYSNKIFSLKSVDQIEEALKRLATILRLDPEWSDIRIDTSSLSDLLKECRKESNRQQTEGVEERIARELMSAVNTKEYVERAEDWYQQIRLDFGNASDPDVKFSLCLALLDLANWLEYPKDRQKSFLFWQLMAEVSLEALNAFSCQVHLMSERFADTVLASGAWAAKSKASGLESQDPPDRPGSVQRDPRAVRLDILSAEATLIKALSKKALVLDIPDDWAMAVLAHPLVAGKGREAFKRQLEPGGFDEALAEIAAGAAARGASSPQLARDVCMAFRGKAETLAEEDPFKPILLFFSGGLLTDLVTDQYPIAWECLAQKCRSAADNPARYVEQRTLVQKMDETPELIDGWIDEAVAAGNLTRAAALAAAACTYFELVPEERLRYAQWIRTIGKDAPPPRIIPVGA